MFKNIFNDSGHKLILLEDSADCRGDEIFTSLLDVIGNDCQEQVALVCTSNVPSAYLRDNDNQIKIIDLFTSSKRINSESKVFSTPPLVSLFTAQNQKIVFIDSISPFIWSHGVREVIRDLKKLLTYVKQIIVLLHSDTLLDGNNSTLLQHSFSFYVNVIKRLGPQQYLVNLVEKKIGVTTVVKHGTEIVILSNSKITSSLYSVEKSDRQLNQPTSMDSLTTFNLGVTLNEAEKRARGNLVLPYLRTEEQPGFNIEYEADDADLEEDPDEDLEL